MSHPDYKNTGSIEARVLEELGELIQAMCKAERFGLDGCHPDHPEATNKDDIINECHDVLNTVNEYLGILSTCRHGSQGDCLQCNAGATVFEGGEEG